MPTQAAAEIRYRVMREEGGVYWLQEARSGQRFLATDSRRMPIVRAAGDGARRVFDALSGDLEAAARGRIRAALKDAGDVVGVFMDDGPDFHGQGHWASRVTYTLLEEALDRPSGDAARQAAVAFLQRNYASFEWFAGAWGLDIYGKFETLKGRDLATCLNVETQQRRGQFVESVAEAWFAALERALRAEAPGALNLGVRFAGEQPTAVLRACGRFCDVASMHAASADDGELDRAWMVTNRPLLLVAQGDEAELSAMARRPMVVGIIAEGVDQAALAHAHEDGPGSFPEEYREPDAIAFTVGPMGDKALQVDLLAEEGTLPPEITLHGGASASLFPEEDGWKLDFESGDDRGLQVMLAGPSYLGLANAPEGAADLNGYNRIVVDAEMPAGMEFKLLVHEAGVSVATDELFDTRGGDEGQAFESALFVAAKGRRRYTYDLARMIPQRKAGWEHGNQHGSRRLHLQSVRGVGIAIVGGQGGGSVLLRGFKVFRG